MATYIKTPFSRTCKHQIPEFSRTQKNSSSRTFQDTLRSQTWLHEIKKCTYQISFRCNCITVNKPKCTTCGCINILQWTQDHYLRISGLFQGFPWPMPFTRTFQAWKSQHFNFRTLQGLYEPCRIISVRITLTTRWQMDTWSCISISTVYKLNSKNTAHTIKWSPIC